MSRYLELNFYELSVPNEPLRLPRKTLDGSMGHSGELGYQEEFFHYNVNNIPTNHYLVRATCPEGYVVVDVPEELRPRAFKRAIEKGFVQHLRSLGLDVDCGKFGSEVLMRDSKSSVLPEVYSHFTAINFKVFYFNKPLRVGLVCSPRLCQRFEMSLEDDLMVRLAINSRVVFRHQVKNEERPDTGHTGRFTLVEVQKSEAVVLNAEGKNVKIDRALLTIPCNKRSLLSYIEKSKDRGVRQKVSFDIDLHAKVLTDERRINTRALRDRNKIVEDFLAVPERRHFALPTHGSPTARILEKIKVHERS